MAEDILLRSISYREGSTLKSTLARRAIVYAELPQDYQADWKISKTKKLEIIKELEKMGIKASIRNLSHDLDLYRGALRLCFGTKEVRAGILRRLLHESDHIATPLLCLIKDGVAELEPEEMASIPEGLMERAGTSRAKKKPLPRSDDKDRKIHPEDIVPEEGIETDFEKLLKKHEELLFVDRAFMERIVVSIKDSAEEIRFLREKDKEHQSRIQSLENELAKLRRSMVRMAQWMIKKKVRSIEDLFQQFPEMLTSREIIEERLSKPSKKSATNLPGGGKYLGDTLFRYSYDDKFLKGLEELPPPKQKNTERALQKFRDYGAAHKTLKSRPAPVVTDDMPKNSFVAAIDDNLRMVYVVFEEDKRLLFLRIAPHNEIWKSEG